jgi:hypothetical protein
MSHAPGLTNRPQLISPAARHVIDQGFARAAASMVAAEIDTVIVFANDHFRNFSFDLMPTFTIGTADEYAVPAPRFSESLRIPVRHLSGAENFAGDLFEGLLGAGFDMACAGALDLFDETSVPLQLVLPGRQDFSMVPIFINAVAPPLAQPSRCHELGRAIGALVKDHPDRRRVAILGTGGMSHWVGLPRTGEVNSDFDRAVLSELVSRSVATLLATDDDNLIQVAGNGAFELRNWLAAYGAVSPASAEVLAYAAAPEIITGVGVVSLTPDTPRRIDV